MNELHRLAAGVRRDDPAAALQLRRELESQMTYIVRRVMRTGRGNSPLSRRILAEAGYLGSPDGCPQEERDRRIARRICESVIARLRPSRDSRGPAAETVCA